MIKIVFIGDIHIKFTNLIEIDKLEHEVVKYCNVSPPTYFILGGDILDTHERVNTQLLNRAYDLIRSFRRIAPVYVIVGNHDYINNQQFLTSEHWMNGMKEWNDVFVVDKPMVIELNNDLKFLLVPYVPNGRFVEAVETVVTDWKTMTCVFAHQEIRGCKMGAITSTDGDVWDDEWPMIISGHIHERQSIGLNVLYPGSAVNHSYSSDNQGVSEFKFDKKVRGYSEFKIDIKLEKKKTFYRTISDVDEEDLKKMTATFTKNHRLALDGEMKDIAFFKKTQTYKDLTKKGVKIVFQKRKINEDKSPNTHDPSRVARCCVFNTILSDLVKKEEDAHLEKDFYEIKN